MSGGRSDIVVVGAGPAGCVMARRLAEAGADVLLLEAGSVAASPRAGLLDVGPGSRVVSRHRATLGGASLDLPRGRTLGGSGAVNGGYCTPARPADLAEWGPDWPRRYAVGLARAAERLRPGLAPMGPVAARVAAAFPGRVSAIGQARRGGRRVTAFDAWDPAGAGVRVRTGARVRSLRWEGGRVAGRCDGVVLDDDEEIGAREVVLCAGAIGTAALLGASGIGPSSGHPVGHGVQEHPEVLLDLPAEVTTGPDPARGLPPLLSHVVRLRVSAEAEIEIRPYAVPLHHVIPGLEPVPHRIGIALMNPVGRGRIRDDGIVELADDPDDAAALAGAAALVADRLDLDGAVTPSTSQHLSGTARIGEVLDESGRVLGVGGLRVADAAALPALPRCGPYYTVLAVAEDLAARVIAERAW
ncbi:mycofactocin system GMC family oxidoreductase MftG [Dietzia sp. B32]|uniref:mycofactocin system GMC family oxidoreductase MftG n=1 Tax=Dietzia sp. B32 TaxID=2915130 RepID=UPI0021AE0A83|nr:mycofactocin system GMC family oxidoreductase MftG [Dietzia sp. B32]UVE96117.1 mycofactocin system GMC family oxidoreductase MftG [Dietzia sp. B32]